MTTIQVHNATTGEVIVRPMTKEELAQVEIDKATDAANKAAYEAEQIARQALLAKLGITADEAKLLLS